MTGPKEIDLALCASRLVSKKTGGEIIVVFELNLFLKKSNFIAVYAEDVEKLVFKCLCLGLFPRIGKVGVHMSQQPFSAARHKIKWEVFEELDIFPNLMKLG
jgi:hypothetical protein